MKRMKCRVCQEFMDFSEDWLCSEECREIRKQKEIYYEQIIQEIDRKNQEENAKKLEKKRLIRERRANRKRARTERTVVLQQKISEQTKKIRALKQRKDLEGDFYTSRAWQELRYRVLRHWGRVCMLCGASRCELHVDHIKPRSKFPNLALSFDNLQVLCRTCNFGKSNKDDKDWRPSA